MIHARTLLLCLALLGCEARRAQVPDWVRSAPAAAATAVSFRTDWALQQPRLPTLLTSYPMAARSLDRFLVRVRLPLRAETGRLTVYQSRPSAADLPGFLLQLGGFQDPGGLQVAIADVFPVDSRLSKDNRDHPLFVILDLGPCHIRAMADGEGRVWLGSASLVARLADGSARSAGDLAAPAGWISETAPVQGFLRPLAMLKGEFARELPEGIESLAWGVTPGPAADAPNGFELALSGSGAAIEQASSWLQRFVAAVAAAPGAPAQPPEILQDSRRLSLRWQLSQEQLDVAMAKLDQPGIPLH
jgi:hypothetical protein